MNTRRIIFWASFIIILALIVWGLIVAMNKPPRDLYDAPAPVSSADNIIGNPNAPITLIEYSDFQCPACRSYSSLLEKLVDESSSTLRIVYRHFPLPQHQNSVAAALAAEAAAKQGKFRQMYEALFIGQDEWATLENPANIFLKYATAIGLDTTKFKADATATSSLEKINLQREEGQKIGINATPTFFLNGKAIRNPQSYEQFKTIIDEAARGANN